jgi:glycosyltransferase involved in cell wall biosynthesis
MALLSALRRLLAHNGLVLLSTPNPLTTELYGRNPYHLRELSRDAFVDLLRRYFPYVKLVDQWLTMGVAFQSDTSTERTRVVDLASTDLESQAGPIIFVAVCGLKPIPELDTVVYLDRTRDLVRTRIQSVLWRNEQLIERYRLKQEQAEGGRLRRLLQQEIQRAEHGAEALAADRDRLKRELAESQGELEAVLSILQARYKGAEHELTSLRQELIQHERTLAAVTAIQETLECVGADLVQLRRAQEEFTAGQDALEEIEAEARRTAEERDEFRDLTQGLLAALTEIETQVEAEERIAPGARADNARIAEEREEFRRQAAEAQTKLAIIERSTTWRALKRASPVLQAARPFLRPPAAAIWRMMRRLRRRPAIRSDVKAPTPAQREQASDRPRFDLLAETALDPTWSRVRRRYALRPDPTFVPSLQARELVDAYVVRPLRAADPSVRRPKLLHVIPNVHIGGSTQLIIDLVQHLSAELEQEVLTSSLWMGKAHDGMSTHHVPHPDPAAMASLLNRVAPDLVHFHYWGLGDDPWYRAVLAAMAGRSIPAIQNINTPIAPLLDDSFRHYVFVSEYVRREFGGSIAPGTPVSVIHPGIDTRLFERFDPAPDREQAIGMVYRLEDDKLAETSIDVFIEIVRRRPRTKAYIIGGGSFLEPYIERTKNAGVRQNFRFTGYVPFASLPRWYDKFAVFVAPVWKESFGQVASFAMVKRQVVAGFKVGALPEILGGSEALGTDVNETAAIVRALLDNPKRLRCLGLKNAARAREIFPVETMVGRYRDVYQSLIDLPPL